MREYEGEGRREGGGGENIKRRLSFYRLCDSICVPLSKYYFSQTWFFLNVVTNRTDGKRS
jgi:hypothetical protein